MFAPVPVPDTRWRDYLIGAAIGLGSIAALVVVLMVCAPAAPATVAPTELPACASPRR